MHSVFKHLTAVLAFVAGCEAITNRLGGPRLMPRDLRELAKTRSIERRADTNPSLLYQEHNFSVPVDHFHNESRYEPHSSAKFNLRYWFDAQYYKPGGPVIVLQSGETSAVGRLVFLQKGIVNILAKATNGIGVIIEHRYYGTSFPTENLSVENLRFLTTDQALADEAYFAQNIKFPGLEKYGDLTSKTTAYIGYGGSYAGAFNAFLRKLYPDVFWGTISSSGVTKAIYDYWQYYEPVAHYGPAKCVSATKTLTHIIDNILIGKREDRKLVQTLKNSFSLPNVTHDDDFASALSSGIQGLQSLVWDPAENDDTLYDYCDNLTSEKLAYPSTESLRSTAEHLIKEGGYSAETELVNQMLNYMGYINATAAQPCVESEETQDQCFSAHESTGYTDISIDNYDSRSWPWQYCTEYGYLQTGSGVPKNQLPVVSRKISVEYESIVCRKAFNLTTPPDTDRINKFGGYDLSYPRLAIIDGEWDPWRPATPHAFGYGAKNRKSTTNEPFLLIPKAVHHWDEYGLFANETTKSLPPASIVQVHEQEVAFVKAWMKEWEDKCKREKKWTWKLSHWYKS
ncbi:serine carboxypeptidase [Acrodontium crateriforme]|uniref:Serine carboxypeptidase n=1 Tax=Acrodontium crateriforme TaxID=150365 RepID=A0AAQ3M284_9PEZI|nr:serine carboxypeptidase [Acrodontium crateriforme]